VSWEICDLGPKRTLHRRYVEKKFATEAEASAVLRDLLRPYPADHEWRQRIVLFYAPEDDDMSDFKARMKELRRERKAARAKAREEKAGEVRETVRKVSQ
jgi:hypothetical protein